MNLYEHLEEMFTAVENQTGLSKHRILIESGVDPTQYRAYKKAGRSLSRPMLVSLSNSAHLSCSITTLLAWKALDEYGGEVITEAAKILKDKKSICKVR